MSKRKGSRVQLGVDIGGTFTDAVLIDDRQGRYRVRHAKALSTPQDPLIGLRDAVGELSIDFQDLDGFVHGTTIVTNLILERTGCRVGLLTTAGFEDVLEIQRSYRPRPLDLQWQKPEPLVPRPLRMGIRERVLPDGSITRDIDRDEVVAAVKSLVDSGVEALAISFLNSYANPTHELSAAQWIADEFGSLAVSVSSEVDPQVREYERTSTTVINAYAMPAINNYVGTLTERIACDVLFMHSGGGVLPPDAVAALPAKLVQSGPAGGVIAAQHFGAGLGFENVIAFDMGGTSTDVSVVVDGRPQRAPETEITWGIPLRVDSLEVRSIGAGGGSIAFRDAGDALRVGPRSAGANPGPACYGAGGTEPTVTDANLVLGLISADEFLGGRFELDQEAAWKTVSGLAATMQHDVETMAKGIHRVVNANMAQLIREMTVDKGRDPRDFAMISFGGAGGQHAYDVARRAGCHTVIFPRHASTLSALGLILADRETTEVQSVLWPVDDIDWSAMERGFEQLRGAGRRHLLASSQDVLSEHPRALMRYEGQTHEVLVDLEGIEDNGTLHQAFEERHEHLFGTKLGDPAEVVSLHLTVGIAESGSTSFGKVTPGGRTTRSGSRRTRTVALFDSDVPVVTGEDVAVSTQVQGPSIVQEVDTAIVVPPDASLTLSDDGTAYIMEFEAL